MRRSTALAAFVFVLASSSPASAAWSQLQRQGICHAMHFVDGTTGYAIHGGSLLDGNSLQKWNGTQWTSITATNWMKGTLSGQLRLFFIDANVGFSSVNASPLTAFVQKTTTAGTDWTNKAITFADAPQNPEVKVEGISFANPSDGVAIGWVSQQFNPTNGKMLVAITHDAGESWSAVPAPTDATYLYGGVMLGTDHIVAYGYQTNVNNGGLWVTRNGGTSWTKSRPGNRPVALDFVSSTVGYAWITCAGPGQGALDKCISKTTNGGDSWTDIQTGYLVDGIGQMRFADENNGIITTGKKVMKTTNGGSVWTDDPLPDTLAGNATCAAYPGPAAFIGVVNGSDHWYVDTGHGGGPKANLPGTPSTGGPQDAGVTADASATSDSGAGSPPGTADPPGTNGDGSDPGANNANAAPDEAGGCSVSPSNSGALPYVTSIALALVCLARSVRRRSRR